MSKTEQVSEALQGLLELHALDRETDERRRELREARAQLENVQETITSMEDRLEGAESELQRLRLEVRRGERELTDLRDSLSQVRARLNAVTNERQYSASMMEQDRLRRDIKDQEERVLQKMQKVEDTEKEKKELEESLEENRSGADSLRQGLRDRISQLEEEIEVAKDRRQNQWIRLDERARQMYDRIREGRSEVVMAPLTDEGVCGHCYTAVTSQQRMRVRTSADLICCEGCGVILYPEELAD